VDQNQLKRAVAREAMRYVTAGQIVGVGTGSTADCFIDELAAAAGSIPAAVASSERTAERLRGCGIAVVDLNEVEALDLYVDGADEINPRLQMIKGGGGALTREKIVAAVAGRFICIADESKLVSVLGRFPLPVEVIPMARRHAMRELEALGGMARLREGCVTDNGNVIIDVAGLTIADPIAVETHINQIAGVVTVGLFARRGADVLLLGTRDGVKTRTAEAAAASGR